ncbi:DUF4367 domain-containing protein [Oscillospiraceae bacterium PP1C4]
MSKPTLNDELFDVMLKHAINDYLEEDYLTDMQKYKDESEPPYSDSFLTGIHKINRTAKWGHRMKSLRKTLPKVAVINLVSLAVLGGLVMSVEAWRVELFNLLFNMKDDHVEFTLTSENDLYDKGLDQIQNKQYFLPSYLPESFTCSSIEAVERNLVIEFIGNDNQMLTFEQYAESDVSFLANIEGKSTKEVQLKNGMGYCMQDNDSLTLLWNKDECSFMLFTTLDKDEAVKVANSMELQKPGE